MKTHLNAKGRAYCEVKRIRPPLTKHEPILTSNYNEVDCYSCLSIPIHLIGMRCRNNMNNVIVTANIKKVTCKKCLRLYEIDFMLKKNAKTS